MCPATRQRTHVDLWNNGGAIALSHNTRRATHETSTSVTRPGVLIPPVEENTDKVRTSQRALRQVERRDVAELADRARQREARVVVLELDVAAVDLHADECERQLTWQKRASVARPGVLGPPRLGDS